MLIFTATLVACGTGDPAAVQDASVAADSGVALDVGAVIDAGVAQDDAGFASDAAVPSLQLQAEIVGPIQRQGSSLHVQLTDSRSAAPSDATVTVSLFLPAHGHGAPAPAVTNEGGGSYQAILGFTMPGTWDVRVRAVRDGLSAEQTLQAVVP
jgi:hypothetical protein